MAGVPEFIARKVYVKGSLKPLPGGFSFKLVNPFTPVTVKTMKVDIGEKVVPSSQVLIREAGGIELRLDTLTPESPYPFPVNSPIEVLVEGISLNDQPLRIAVETIETGPLAFGIQETSNTVAARKWQPKRKLVDTLKGPLRVIARIDAEKTIGEINPHIYGHFIEHLERCVYGGIWTDTGEKLRDDVLRMIQALKPPVIRYPGGNFASAYHWEDGIGPKDQRPTRYDPAWKSEETNFVGTDEFMSFCRQVGAEPYICVNDATGTPEEAARWVAYCNEDSSGEQGRRRAANGYPEPYRVRLWGVGNEVWGQWQVGHTDVEGYIHRLRPIVETMRAVDPAIKIVAVGDTLGAVENPKARRWNETVLRLAGDLIDYISFHTYPPEREGWLDQYDQEALYYTVCAAPQSVEKDILRLADLIGMVAPGRGIKVALDEWNLWLAPPEGAASMHHVIYTMRDALFVAGALNAFQRQCKHLTLANLAQMVNVLPLIVTDDKRAYATPIYYPFEMYRHMESVALEVAVDTPTFNSQALGITEAMEKIPFVDVSATCSRGGNRVVLGIVNRHPTRRVDLSVRLYGFGDVHPTRGWLLRHSDPLAENSFSNPENVKMKEVDLKAIRNRKRFTLDLPPCSVSVIQLES